MASPRIEELRKRLEKEPGSRLFAQLAEELRKDGELEEAIRVAREGLQKHPNYPSARMTLGRALLDTGDLAAARSDFESVLRGAPDNILASRFLGECLEGLGEMHAARERYKTTLALAPGDKQVLARLQAVEAALAGSARAPAAPAARAAVAAPAPPSHPAPAPAEEPPPIPLVQVEEEGFELMGAHEAPATAIAGAPPAPPPPMGAPPAAAAAAGETVPKAAEPPPIPLAQVEEEGFELEAAYEAPKGAVGASETAAPAPAKPVEALELEAGAGPPHEAARDLSAAAFPRREPAPAAEAELTSATLAELYFSQGFTDKAIEVYRQLLEREPANERARARLRELEALERHLRAEEQRGASGGAPPDPREARRQAVERTIARLEGLLAAIKRG